VLGSWVLDIRPELDLDMGSGLVEVRRDCQHASLAGSNRLVDREQGGTKRSDTVRQDVFGSVYTGGSGRDLDGVSVTADQLLSSRVW
jgi:hypothetical protein